MVDQQTAAPSVQALPILELAMAFYGSRALMSAVELDVFTTLADGAMSRELLEEKVGLHPRTSADFLDALVSLGLLRRDGGQYANSEAADNYLVRGRGLFVGGFAEMGNASLYPIWSKLTDLLRTGEPQIPPGGNFFEGLYSRPDAARKFMDAMDTFNGDVARTIAEAIDFTGVRTLVDVGGARGDLACKLVAGHEHVSAVCFDLPGVQPLFTELVSDAELTERVAFHSGDFVTDALPDADVYVFGHILHGRDLEQRQDLVNRAFAGLSPGGTLVIYDRMIDDERSERTLSLLGSVGMALVSKVGSEYTPADCRGWLETAGFQVSSVRPIAATDTMVVARKPE